LQNISKIDKQALVEKHLISPEHSKDDHQCRGLAISEDGSISIMINEARPAPPCPLPAHLCTRCRPQGQ
ncbi:MAG: hypothetical protein IIW84_05375, partial [Selenomonadaceae bacterium]|nr:hypothetical protein [Selenomonadaceae bacterium]